MADSDPVMLSGTIARLASYSPLSDEDRSALLTLPCTRRSLEPGTYMDRDNDHSSHCIVLISGFAFGHKLSKEGKRQIVSIHVADEIANIQNLYLDNADHNLQALTRCSTALISRNALRSLIVERPSIGSALFAYGMVEASIHREWMLNIGRRDARARVAHFLCEFAVRTHAPGIGLGRDCDLPMTQEQIGDAVSLSAVHVNRTLKSLVRDGLITKTKRGMTFLDWNRLKDEAGFNTRYLHLDQSSVRA